MGQLRDSATARARAKAIDKIQKAAAKALVDGFLTKHQCPIHQKPLVPYGHYRCRRDGTPGRMRQLLACSVRDCWVRMTAQRPARVHQLTQKQVLAAAQRFNGILANLSPETVAELRIEAGQ